MPAAHWSYLDSRTQQRSARHQSVTKHPERPEHYHPIRASNLRELPSVTNFKVALARVLTGGSHGARYGANSNFRRQLWRWSHVE